jgi:hypothetical protein
MEDTLLLANDTLIFHDHHSRLWLRRSVEGHTCCVRWDTVCGVDAKNAAPVGGSLLWRFGDKIVAGRLIDWQTLFDCKVFPLRLCARQEIARRDAEAQGRASYVLGALPGHWATDPNTNAKRFRLSDSMCYNSTG